MHATSEINSNTNKTTNAKKTVVAIWSQRASQTAVDHVRVFQVQSQTKTGRIKREKKERKMINRKKHDRKKKK